MRISSLLPVDLFLFSCYPHHKLIYFVVNLVCQVTTFLAVLVINTGHSLISELDTSSQDVSQILTSIKVTKKYKFVLKFAQYQK